jgi:hypothetical protein
LRIFGSINAYVKHRTSLIQKGRIDLPIFRLLLQCSNNVAHVAEYARNVRTFLHIQHSASEVQ